jgi:hypothetical protein
MEELVTQEGAFKSFEKLGRIEVERRVMTAEWKGETARLARIWLEAIYIERQREADAEAAARRAEELALTERATAAAERAAESSERAAKWTRAAAWASAIAAIAAAISAAWPWIATVWSLPGAAK